MLKCAIKISALYCLCETELAAFSHYFCKWLYKENAKLIYSAEVSFRFLIQWKHQFWQLMRYLVIQDKYLNIIKNITLICHQKCLLPPIASTSPYNNTASLVYVTKKLLRKTNILKTMLLQHRKSRKCNHKIYVWQIKWSNTIQYCFGATGSCNLEVIEKRFTSQIHIKK